VNNKPYLRSDIVAFVSLGKKNILVSCRNVIIIIMETHWYKVSKNTELQ